MNGDELLVIMPKASDDDVCTVLERLRGALAAEPLVFGSDSFKLAATIGGATGCEESGAHLLAAAHEALEAARAEGPDRIVAGAKVELDAARVEGPERVAAGAKVELQAVLVQL